jgi:predicted ribosomally synthesized peptide with SipW-like signal peptide
MVSNKKKLGAIVGGVAVVGAAVALTAGTFSYFSSTQNESGTVGSGTLHLDLSAGQVGNANALTGSNIAPGWVGSQTLTLTNSGSLDGELRVQLGNTSADAALEHDLVLTIGDANGHTLASNIPLDQVVTAGSATNGVDAGPLAAGASETYTLTLSLPSTAGNEAQGKSVTVDFKAALLQVVNNAPTTAMPN